MTAPESPKAERAGKRTESACVLLSTADTIVMARKIAQALVERKLAACVNIVPGVESIYYWQGDIQKDKEILLVIKSIRSHVTKVQEAIRELHTYSVPECVVLPIQGGSKEYLDWVLDSVK